DPVALGVARHERVNDFRFGWIGRVHSMNAKVRPDRRQASERLPAAEPVATFDAFGPGRREQYRDVISALGMAGRKYVTGGSGFEQPALRGVAGAPEIRGGPRPIEVHVDRQRRWRRVVAEAPLLVGHTRQ